VQLLKPESTKGQVVSSKHAHRMAVHKPTCMHGGEVQRAGDAAEQLVRTSTGVRLQSRRVDGCGRGDQQVGRTIRALGSSRTRRDGGPRRSLGESAEADSSSRRSGTDGGGGTDSRSGSRGSVRRGRFHAWEQGRRPSSEGGAEGASSRGRGGLVREGGGRQSHALVRTGKGCQGKLPGKNARGSESVDRARILKQE